MLALALLNVRGRITVNRVLCLLRYGDGSSVCTTVASCIETRVLFQKYSIQNSMIRLKL